MSEAVLEKQCRKEAARWGCRLYKWVCPSLRGVPDDFLVKPAGEIIFIEFKNPNGKGVVSLQQAKRHAELRELGCRVEVVSSFDVFCELLSETNDEQKENPHE